MKLVAIRGENLASLADPFEIRLADGPLAQSGLFAITGAVGAGKSTLLDALCLALFDRTPRLGARGGVLVGLADDAARIAAADVRGILRRGAGSGFAEVEFVGRSGERFVARWEVHRARNNPDGKIQSQSMSLTEVGSGNPRGGTKTETLQAIEDELGLSFDQFRRSVVLAQGEFATFLRTKAADRAALLERMTDTAIYGDLSIGAHRRAAAARAEIAKIEAQIADIDVLDDEARRTLDAELTAAKAGLAATGGVIATFDERARIVRDRDAAEAQARSREARIEAAAKDEVEAQAACDAAKEHVDALEAERESMQPVLEAARVLDAKIDELRRALTDQEARVDAAVACFAAAEHGIARRDAGRVPDDAAYRDVRRELERLVAVGDELADVEEQRESVTTGHAKAVEALDACRRARDAKSAELAAVEDAGDLDALAAAREAADAAAEAAARRLQLATLANARAAAAADVDDIERRLAADEPRIEALTRDAARAREELAATRRDRDRAQRHAALEAHRAALADGEPCPLCGSAEHPYVEHAPDEGGAAEAALAAAETALSDAERSLAAATERVRIHRDSLTQAVARADEAAESLRQLEVRSGVAGEALSKEHLAECARELEARERERAAARDAEREARDRLAVATRLRAELADVLDQLREGERDLREREKTIAGLDDERDKLRAREADVRRALEEMLEARRDAVDELRASAVATKRGHDAAIAERAARFGGRTADEVSREWQERKADAVRVLESRRSQLTEAVKSAATARAELESARQSSQVAATRLDALDTELAARLEQLAIDAGDDPERSVREVHAAQESERDRLSLARGLDDSARKRRDGLSRSLDAARAASEPRLAVDDLIGSADGRKFRSFAQGLTFEQLLVRSNEHLAELTPRYRLMSVPGEHLDLQIVDCEMGNEIRSVHSLSGGESFLVSLALALGLASMAASNATFDTLLIDEGLGTLDPDSLETVLAALDALQATGYQVGIISHVDGLAERVGARVHVQKLGGGRSAVRVLDASSPATYAGDTVGVDSFSATSGDAAGAPPR